MKASVGTKLIPCILFAILIGGCAPAPTPLPTAIPPTATPSPVPPTLTPEPTATSTPVPTNTAAPFPTGIFKAVKPKSQLKNDQLNFLEDGTYRQMGGALTISGTYAVQGDQLVLTEIKNSGVCGDFPATYAWSFDGQVLSLTTVENKCPAASIFTVEGDWTKQP